MAYSILNYALVPMNISAMHFANRFMAMLTQANMALDINYFFYLPHIYILSMSGFPATPHITADVSGVTSHQLRCP